MNTILICNWNANSLTADNVIEKEIEREWLLLLFTLSNVNTFNFIECILFSTSTNDYVSALMQVFAAIAISRFSDYVLAIGGAANVNSTKRTHS